MIWRLHSIPIQTIIIYVSSQSAGESAGCFRVERWWPPMGFSTGSRKLEDRHSFQHGARLLWWLVTRVLGGIEIVTPREAWSARGCAYTNCIIVSHRLWFDGSPICMWSCVLAPWIMGSPRGVVIIPQTYGLCDVTFLIFSRSRGPIFYVELVIRCRICWQEELYF